MVLRQHADFRRIWIGQVVSVVGDGMQRIALLWWARHTGGNGLLTAVALSTMIPVVAASPFGGWLADRHDRRTLMVLADLGRMSTVAAMAVLVLWQHPAAAIVCTLVALSALGTAVFDPTYSAVVPTLIEPEQRPAANGLNMANSAVGGLVGPLVGGLLLARFSIGTVLFINAATFAWSAAWVARARVPRLAGAGARRGGDHAERTGRAAFVEVIRDRQVRRLVGLASVLNMVAAPVPLLIVALAVDRFHTGSTAFGVLEIMVSAGILAGALLAARFAAWPVVRPLVMVAVCLGVAGSLPYLGSAAAFVLGGFAIAIANTGVITMFQSAVPAEVQGRVFGVAGALGEGLRPLGLALGAPLLALVGVQGAFAVVGVGMLLATIAWARPKRSLRAGVPAWGPELAKNG